MSSDLNILNTEDLMELKAKYPDNESIAKLVDGIVEARLKELAEIEVKETFTASLETYFNNPDNPLIAPEGIYNVYARLAEVEVEKVTGQETVGKGKAKKVIDIIEKVKEKRWVIEANKAISITHKQASTSGKAKASKRAIQVFKANGTNLESQGKFSSGNKACEHLGLNVGGDSATRVLSRLGYIVQPYDGEDLTA